MPAGFAYRFDRAFMALDAAAKALGVALQSTSIGAPHLREKKLRPIFRDDSFATPVQAHFLVCPARHWQRSEVTNFLDWVRREARAGRRPAGKPDPSQLRTVKTSAFADTARANLGLP